MIRAFSLPLSRPLGTASGTIDERRGFLFAREGGVGEATPLPDWTESRAACERGLETADAAADWEDALAACEGAPAARHAVSLAKLDAEARDATVSLARHLCDDPADSIRVNATVGDGTPEQTTREARAATERGFETLKVKVGARSVAADVERLRAVREVTDATLRADANGAWTRQQAREAFDAFTDLGVDYVEQPLSAEDLAGHRGLRGGDVGVALDESLTEHALADVLDAADCVILKPMALGGVDRALDAATDARGAGVDPVVTTTVDAVVARTAAVHLAAAIPDVSACGLATADRLADDLAADPAPVEDGRVRVPEAPGHGVSVDLAEVNADA
ncbi:MULTISPECIES: mandelate racemase/muconate lactonizing enzyme family protein [Halobacterium]|uniref:mandelate racemase/muconate lactonizing enzyme family protein n=1 Tax=Halobacterium TaxID=2239 RepID=UPI00073ED615|nr:MULTISPECIES: o-succinylbenzoate synthase [Halobacterium]MCG1003045.1 o-succinylbenzoate synthase [Halobacterium noricense]